MNIKKIRKAFRNRSPHSHHMPSMLWAPIERLADEAVKAEIIAAMEDDGYKIRGNTPTEADLEEFIATNDWTWRDNALDFWQKETAKRFIKFYKNIYKDFGLM